MEKVKTPSVWQKCFDRPVQFVFDSLSSNIAYNNVIEMPALEGQNNRVQLYRGLHRETSLNSNLFSSYHL